MNDTKSLHFVIVGQPATKKNSQQIYVNKRTGKRFVSQSDAYKQYEKSAIAQLQKVNESPCPIEYQVTVTAIFYRQDKRKVDLTNLLEALDDVLVRSGIIADDNYTIIASHDGSRVTLDRDNPRTEITIAPYIEREISVIH
jgi:Holliday junction resolvase RusA-like endonuclease